VFDEIGNCYEPKRQNMLDRLQEIEYKVTEVIEPIESIANDIIKSGVLKEGQRKDCRHIACAVYTECDYLVSWNIKHLSNVKTEKGVRTITNLLGCKDLKIVTPKILLELED
jgi:hypothetical protein